MIPTWAELPADKQRKFQEYLDSTAIGKRIAAYAGGRTVDLDFALWLLALEHACQRRCSVSFLDLADYHWLACHESGMTPKAALAAALAAEGLV